MKIAAALKALRACRIKPTDYLALDALREGPQIVGEIVRATGIRDAQLTRTLRGLEAGGLVTRTLGKDKRNWIMELTAKGRRVLGDVG